MNGVPGSPNACLRCGGDVAADRDFCDWCGGVHPELCSCPQCARDRLLSHPDGPHFDLDPANDYLVTRLHNSLAAADLCHEAAREITRLRIDLWKSSRVQAVTPLASKRVTYAWQLLGLDGETWVDLVETEDYAEVIHFDLQASRGVRLVRRTITNEVIPS
jgi:hypothetical protein